MIHYTKTFSPNGTGYRDPTQRLGEPTAVSTAAWADLAAAAERGSVVYHGVAGCHHCHPSYDATFTRTPTPTYPGPDFTRDDLRVAHHDDGVYRVIAYGVPQANMPSYRHTLSNEDIWALVHFVESMGESP